jgi:hypothetical protein
VFTLLEICAPQFVIGFFLLEDVIDNDQNAVGSFSLSETTAATLEAEFCC